MQIKACKMKIDKLVNRRGEVIASEGQNLRSTSWWRAVVFLACYASKHYVFKGRRSMLL